MTAQDSPADPPVLSAAAILRAATRPVQAVHVPELRGIVHVREMTVGERDEYEIGIMDADSQQDKRRLVRSSLLVRTICDAEGARLFADDQAEELAGTLGARAADRLFEAARAQNALGTADVEALEKN